MAKIIENLDGKWVTITKVSDSGINTAGKSGIVSKYDTKAGKYLIEFENGWQGWYHRHEFALEEGEDATTPEEVRALITCHAKDLVGAFMYYDRRDDEELCLYMIEKAVANHIITVDEIIETFSTELRTKIEQCIKELE